MSTAAAGPFAARRAVHRAVRRRRPVPARKRPDGASRAGPPRATTSATDAELIGPFLCPASRLDELRTTLDDDAVLDVQVVVDTGIGGLADAVAAVTRDDHDPAIFQEHGFEIALRADADLGTAARRLVAAILADGPRPGAHGVRRGADRGARPRPRSTCWPSTTSSPSSGPAAPTPRRTPAKTRWPTFIVACLDREIAFKCTAGLHHAVRNTDARHRLRAARVPQHPARGVGRARRRRPRRSSRPSSPTGTPTAVADRVRAHLSPERAARIRRWFRSFGTCSIQEPVDDLLALGVSEIVRPRDEARMTTDLVGASAPTARRSRCRTSRTASSRTTAPASRPSPRWRSADSVLPLGRFASTGLLGLHAIGGEDDHRSTVGRCSPARRSTRSWPRVGRPGPRCGRR